MKIIEVEVDELKLAVSFSGYDLAAWRNHPEPEYHDLDDDEDHPTPAYVYAITGIDPDDEGWDDEPDGTKVFCPTGPGGGVDPTCSPGKTGGGFSGKPANPKGTDTLE